MKSPITTGFIPSSPLQRLKTRATLTANQKAQQQHREKAETLREEAEALAQQGEHARAETLKAKAREHEQTIEQLEDEASKEFRVY